MFRKENRSWPRLRLGFGRFFLPVKSPGDHQMNHQEQFVFETEHDSLSDRRRLVTFFPEASLKGGSTERRRKGLERRMS